MPGSPFSGDHDAGPRPLNDINCETGNRVHFEVVDADTREEVPQEDRVKGYKVDRSKAQKRAAPARSAPKRKKLKRAS